MKMKEKLILRLSALFTSFLFISCEEIVLEDDISEEEIFLVAPQDNAQFNTTTVNLNWEAVQYAKKYHIQIAKPNFDAPTQILVDTEVTTLSYTAQLNIGTYQWRVQAISGSTSTPYKTRTITIANNSNFFMVMVRENIMHQRKHKGKWNQYFLQTSPHIPKGKFLN